MAIKTNGAELKALFVVECDKADYEVLVAVIKANKGKL